MVIFLIAIFFSLSVYGQTNLPISGRVIDSKSSEPLIGVSVVVKNTGIGTITDYDGAFKIDASLDSILIVSYMGYNTQEIEVANGRPLNILLEENTELLDELIVIGYGVQKKSDLTGAVGRFSAKDVDQQPVISIDQALQGKVAGVQITQSSGSPGAGMNFVIRGGNSLSSNQPLIVLDGYPIDMGSGNLSLGANVEVAPQPGTNPLANLNPNDIESIEILKDASSTAIYGSRGANGVVIITTKRGKNTRDEISFNYRTDFNEIRKTIPVLNTQDFINFANEAALNDGLDSVYKSSAIADLTKINNNWQDQIYKTGVSNNYQLSLSGGEDRGKYYLAGFYNQMNGIMMNSGFNNGGIRFNYDRKFSNALNVKFNKARQAAITTELIEIISGVESMK